MKNKKIQEEEVTKKADQDLPEVPLVCEEKEEKLIDKKNLHIDITLAYEDGHPCEPPRWKPTRP